MIKIIDQDGNKVAVDVRIDGGPATWIKPGRRHRIKVRPQVVALLVDRFEILDPPKGTAADWIVNDIRIGNRSQFSQCGDRPEEDGVPGDVFSIRSVDTFISFETLQTAMDLVIDVTYVGPNPEGQPFACNIGCRVAR